MADAVDAIHEYEKYMALAEIETLRFVVSNTTEAGIVYDASDRFEMNPPATFPGKLTKFLYHRFETFGGDRGKGLVMLPVELIDDNGIMLRKCVMQQIENWGLSGNSRPGWRKPVSLLPRWWTALSPDIPEPRSRRSGRSWGTKTASW